MAYLGIRLLEAQKKKLGEEHPDILDSMNSLALVYQRQGRWKEAEDMGTILVELSKKVLGEDHYKGCLYPANFACHHFKGSGQNKRGCSANGGWRCRTGKDVRARRSLHDQLRVDSREVAGKCQRVF